MAGTMPGMTDGTTDGTMPGITDGTVGSTTDDTTVGMIDGSDKRSTTAALPMANMPTIATKNFMLFAWN